MDHDADTDGSASGIVFDIVEFAVHDGPGIRTTVFLKGCPLRCAWCHNPEGFDGDPETICTRHRSRVSGDCLTAEALANRLNRQAGILRASGGGVTFSGGEPLQQADFVTAVIDRLDNTHALLDTSGEAPPGVFTQVLERVDLVHFDLKLMDPVEHKQWTGRDNRQIHLNLEQLDRSGVPYVVRVPLIPGVTDTTRNLLAIAGRVVALSNVMSVELLPYNKGAGGKYKACGMEFTPAYNEAQPVNTDLGPFERIQVPVKVV